MSGSLFSYVDLEAGVPARHPLRLIREIVNDVLGSLSADFASAYSDIVRPSIAPERLIRALLLQAFYSVRSKRQLMEQIEAWASMKSFRPKDGDDGGGAGRNAERDFHGEKRSNETHESTTAENYRPRITARAMAGKAGCVSRGMRLWRTATVWWSAGT